jgi:hypothetical protein
MTLHENLVGTKLGYMYYDKGKYPLNIEVDVNNEYIDVTVRKFFKNKVVKEMTKSSKVLKKMSENQIKDYVLDVVDIFFKK